MNSRLVFAAFWIWARIKWLLAAQQSHHRRSDPHLLQGGSLQMQKCRPAPLAGRRRPLQSRGARYRVHRRWRTHPAALLRTKEGIINILRTTLSA